MQYANRRLLYVVQAERIGPMRGARDLREIVGTRLRIGPIEAIAGIPVVDIKPATS